MKFKIPDFLLFTFSFLLFSGCTSFNLSQTNRFINEDGQVISVDYGSGKSEYVSKFNSPLNGKEFEFKSKLRVRVTMPDGDRFMAFHCFNDLKNGSGTLYRSDNGEWTYHANGFTCTVYRLVEEKVYQPVFHGVVCQSPEKPRPEQRR